MSTADSVTRPELVGRRVRAMRRAKGLTQSTLSSEIIVSRSYIADIESGRTLPSKNFVEALVQAYDVNAVWLMTGNNDMFRKPAERVIPVEQHVVDAFLRATEEIVDGIGSSIPVREQQGARHGVNLQQMESVITAAAEALEETGLRMRPEKFAQFCTALYEMELESGTAPSKAVVLRLVKSAA